MTLVQIRFRLQATLTNDQLSKLAEFANTYGMRRFDVSADGHVLQFDYDASRLKATQVEHVLRMASIPVLERVA